MRGSFQQNDSLITIILFELLPILVISPVANLMHHPLFFLKCYFSNPFSDFDFYNHNDDLLFLLTIIFSFFSLKTTPSPFHSKLVRVCHDDRDYYSYTEIPIECISGGNPSRDYNLVQVNFPKKQSISKNFNFPAKKMCILSLNRTENVITQGLSVLACGYR